MQDLLAGASSRVGVGFLLMPFTVLKTRAESSYYQRQTLLTSLKHILAQPGGIRGLFAGVRVSCFSYVDTVLNPRYESLVLGHLHARCAECWSLCRLLRKGEIFVSACFSALACDSR